MMEEKEMDNILKVIKDIESGIQKLSEREKERTKMAKQYFNSTLRKGEFLIDEKTKNLPIEFQKAADYAYIASILLNKKVSDLRLWNEVEKEFSEIRKAMSDTTGVGGDWVPTGFSTDLIQKVRLDTKVASLFRRIDMPRDPYTLPTATGDATVYLQGEAKKDTPSKYKASTPTTGKLELSAKKLAARVVFSEELDEDSLIPILPFVRDNIITALAEAVENAIVNGDDSASHMDSDVTDSDDVRKAFKGLRKRGLMLTNSQVDAGNSKITKTLLAQQRAKMKKYGIDPSKLAYVVSPLVYNQFLSELDNVQTLDKYGPKAIVFTGELGKYMGVPIIVSDFMRDDLKSDGTYGGSHGAVLLVYRPGWLIGDRRKITFKTKEDIDTGQNVAVTTQRLDFIYLYTGTTDYVVSLMRNVKLT
ncbi:MAG: phage major capsid protein [Candidatus Altiarchaeales archaeon]|nr:MAG: phage major capsid protein [Candidatus Altiarchaeales archaeon]